MKRTDLTVSIESDAEPECYVTIKGKKIPCTREVYLTIKRPGRKQAMRDYRNQRPMINGRRCTGDCSHCAAFDGVECTYTGDVSLDQMSEDGVPEPQSSHNVESEALRNVLYSQMLETLKNEDKRCLEVFALMVKELPQRKIAEELSIADGTVTYYVKKIRQKLVKFNQ